VGTVIAIVVIIVVLGLVALFSYQINEADKAHAKARKELDKSAEMVRILEKKP
jgi:hypothetical protein